MTHKQKKNQKTKTKSKSVTKDKVNKPQVIIRSPIRYHRFLLTKEEYKYIILPKQNVQDIKNIYGVFIQNKFGSSANGPFCSCCYKEYVTDICPNCTQLVCLDCMEEDLPTDPEVYIRAGHNVYANFYSEDLGASYCIDCAGDITDRPVLLASSSNRQIGAINSKTGWRCYEDIGFITVDEACNRHLGEFGA